MPFEERQFLYFIDTEQDGERRRTYLIPAFEGALTTTGPFPEWGEDPSDTCGWRRIPEGAVTFDHPGEGGFPDGSRPVSLPETASMKVTIHYDIVAKLDGLYEVLTLEHFPGVGITGDHSTASVTISNTWVVTSDVADPGNTFETFVTVYTGCQVPAAEIDGVCVPGLGLTETVELFDITKVITEGLTMKQVCAEATGGASVGPHKFAYALIWPGASHTITVCEAQIEESAVYYHYNELFFAMEVLCSSYYETLLRSAFGSADFLFLKPTEDHSEEFGHPFTHYTFKKSGYATDISSGDPLAENEIYVIGAIVLDNGGEVVGGLFHPQEDGNDTFATDESLRSFLIRMTTATLCKVIPRQLNRNTVAFYFMGVDDSLDAPREITLDDLVFTSGEEDEDGNEAAIPYKRFDGVLANAQAQAWVTGGADKPDCTATNFGSPADAGETITLMLHTAPSAGDGIDYWTDVRPGSDDDFPGEQSMRRVVYSWFNLYYFGQPLDASRVIPIAVHHECVIQHSPASSSITAHATAFALPTADDIGLASFLAADISITGYDTIVAIILGIQNEAGLLVNIPRIYVEKFGSTGQTGYTVTLLTSIASYDQIGSHFNLAPADGDGNYSLQAFMNGGAGSAQHLFGRCVLHHVRPYAKAGDEDSGYDEPVSECILLGTGRQ